MFNAEVPSALIGLESTLSFNLRYKSSTFLSCWVSFSFIVVISVVLMLTLLVKEDISDSFLEDLVWIFPISSLLNPLSIALLFILSQLKIWSWVKVLSWALVKIGLLELDENWNSPASIIPSPKFTEFVAGS